MTGQLSFNGVPAAVPAGPLEALLVQQGCDLAAAMACAVNGQFVPRAQWPLRMLNDGDRVDVVVPVTGG